MTEMARKRLAVLLRKAREDKGLSQEEVADRLDVPRPAISQIENGHRRVEALELAMLAKLYGRPFSYFADEEPKESGRIEALARTAASLSDRDKEEVLRFAQYLRQKAERLRKGK